MDNPAVEIMSDNSKSRNASDLIENAIHDVDSILENVQIEDELVFEINGGPGASGDTLEDTVHQVNNLMEDIRTAIESTIDDQPCAKDEGRSQFIQLLNTTVNEDTIKFYKLLFNNKQNEEPESLRIQRLTQEKRSLQLNVSVLTDQLEIQNEKQIEMDLQLNQAKDRLRGYDERLKEELLSKTKTESYNLQLLQEKSSMTALLTSIKDDARKYEEKHLEAEKRNKELMEEIQTLKEQLSSSKRQDEVIKTPPSTASTPDEGVVITDKKQLETKLENLKMPEPSATSTPTSTNIKSAMIKSKVDENIPVNTLNNEPETLKADDSESSKNNSNSTQLKSVEETDCGDIKNKEKSSTSDSSTKSVKDLSVEEKGHRRSRSVERLFGKRINNLLTSSNVDMTVGTNENKQVIASQPQDNNDATKDLLNTSTCSNKSAGNKSTSTPNLALNSVLPPTTSKKHQNGNNKSQQPTPSVQRKKMNQRFKKLFNFKLRRSHSTQINDDDSNDVTSMMSYDVSTTSSNFNRGGFRATTGGSSKNKITASSWNKFPTTNQKQNITLPTDAEDAKNFATWRQDALIEWLTSIGLGSYTSSNSCRNWLKNGRVLLQATNHEIEKELGIRDPLHKKKLTLHIQSLNGEDLMVKGAMKMNGVWLARWLDDIGLPQYKNQFNEARVDGLLLHHLTVGDVNKLGVTNLFHLLSLRRAISVLRQCDFDPTQLQRRPQEDSKEERLELWTNHRVMEWLRLIDLAEYAPNLRGSGVHGAVMVNEPVFNGETLASLLHIPNNKTLLRRHLSTKLMDLLPKESCDVKYQRANTSGYHPLSINAKYKIGRRSFFSSKSTTSTASNNVQTEYSSKEFVCPIPANIMPSLQSHRNQLQEKIQMHKPDESDVVSPKSFNESTNKELNDFSTQLTSLTNQLATAK